VPVWGKALQAIAVGRLVGLAQILAELGDFRDLVRCDPDQPVRQLCGGS
jgi:hypothetical protein